MIIFFLWTLQNFLISILRYVCECDRSEYKECHEYSLISHPMKELVDSWCESEIWFYESKLQCPLYIVPTCELLTVIVERFYLFFIYFISCHSNYILKYPIKVKFFCTYAIVESYTLEMIELCRCEWWIPKNFIDSSHTIEVKVFPLKYGKEEIKYLLR